MLIASSEGIKQKMSSHSSIVKSVLELYKQGYGIVKIARVLNLHIEEVANVINEYT
jgi:transposase-like protein